MKSIFDHSNSYSDEIPAFIELRYLENDLTCIETYDYRSCNEAGVTIDRVLSSIMEDDVFTDKERSQILRDAGFGPSDIKNDFGHVYVPAKRYFGKISDDTPYLRGVNFMHNGKHYNPDSNMPAKLLLSPLKTDLKEVGKKPLNYALLMEHTNAAFVSDEDQMLTRLSPEDLDALKSPQENKNARILEFAPTGS